MKLTPCYQLKMYRGCTVLIKIHNPDNPLRSVVEYTGSIGCNVPISLADLLAPIVGKTWHHSTKQSKHLANEMCSTMVEQDDMFLSHDVESLNNTLDVIKK